MAPIRSTSDPGRGRLEPEAEPLRVGDQRRAASPAPCGASNSWTSPSGRLDRLAPASPAPWRGRSGPRSGPAAASPSAAATALELAVAPALDPVGEQVAARLGQRHRRDRRQQRLVVGRPPALARLEDLQRAGAALALRRGPAAAPGWRRSSPRRCRRSGRAGASPRPSRPSLAAAPVLLAAVGGFLGGGRAGRCRSGGRRWRACRCGAFVVLGPQPPLEQLSWLA